MNSEIIRPALPPPTTIRLELSFDELCSLVEALWTVSNEDLRGAHGQNYDTRPFRALREDLDHLVLEARR